MTKTVSSSITVRNTLVSILGDSYASGEGFPPFRNPDGTIDWDEPACDRSRWSRFVRSALALEQSDPRSNVTVVDVACSGGEILEQETNPAVARPEACCRRRRRSKQPSQQSNTGPGDFMPPQIDQLAAIAAGQTYDAGLLSIGGNDAGLSPVIISCATTDVLPVVVNGFPDSGISGSLKSAIQGFPNCQDAAQVSGSWTSPTFRTSRSPAGPMAPALRSATVLVAHPGEQHEPDHSRVRRGYRCLTSDASATDPVQDNPELEEAVFSNLQSPATGLRQTRAVLPARRGAAQCKTQKLVNGVPAARPPHPNPFGTARSGNLTQAMYPDLTQKGTPATPSSAGSSRIRPSRGVGS